MLLDPQLLFMVAVLGALAALAWWRGGEPLVRRGVSEGGELLLRFGLLIAVSFVAAGIAQVLLPREWIQGAMGRGSGLRGIAIASLAGALTPAGPFVSMPIAVVMLKAGAAPAAVIAFLTSWSVLAVHRLVSWEMPILGPRFAIVRWLVSLALPFVAGLVAWWLDRWLARSS